MTGLVRLDVEQRGDVTVAGLRGELDMSNADRLGEEIAEAAPPAARGLVVDLARIRFIDSSGVAMLFRLARRVSSRRQGVVVVAPAESPVARVLEIAGFERAAPTRDTVEEAVSAVRGAHA